MASWPVNIVDDEPVPGTDWLPVYAAVIGAGVPRRSLVRAAGCVARQMPRDERTIDGDPSIPAGVRVPNPGSDRPTLDGLPRGPAQRPPLEPGKSRFLNRTEGSLW